MADPSRPPARLVALSASARPSEFPLEAARCELGRSTLRHVVIALDTVSRLHAVIEQRQERFWLADAGSTNGTFVNRQPITEPHLLKDGDEIGLGGPEPLLRFLDGNPTIVRPAGAPVAAARLHFDPVALGFVLDAQPFSLPPTQMRLLHHLLTHPGEVCTRKSCAEAAWGRPYDPGLDRDALDKVVSKLRRRLAAVDPALAAALCSRRGDGYLWLG
jgi:DNA-binding response OmpR family regulator